MIDFDSAKGSFFSVLESIFGIFSILNSVDFGNSWEVPKLEFMTNFGNFRGRGSEFVTVSAFLAFKARVLNPNGFRIFCILNSVGIGNLKGSWAINKLEFVTDSSAGKELE